MDTQNQKNVSQEISEKSVLLAKKARSEITRTGKTTIICPKCNTYPQVMTNLSGDRTKVACKCKYIYTEEINL